MMWDEKKSPLMEQDEGDPGERLFLKCPRLILLVPPRMSGTFRDNMPCLFAIVANFFLFAIKGHMPIPFTLITLGFLSTCAKKGCIVRCMRDKHLRFIWNTMLRLESNPLGRTFCTQVSRSKEIS